MAEVITVQQLTLLSVVKVNKIIAVSQCVLSL